MMACFKRASAILVACVTITHGRTLDLPEHLGKTGYQLIPEGRANWTKLIDIE